MNPAQLPPTLFAPALAHSHAAWFDGSETGHTGDAATLSPKTNLITTDQTLQLTVADIPETLVIEAVQLP